MKKLMIAVASLLIVSCATSTGAKRGPSSVEDLTGNYLGEGHFKKRDDGLSYPAVRLYLDPVPGEAGNYYGVIFEYDKIQKMAPPYLATQKFPALNEVIGYLNHIGARISAFKVIKSNKENVYEFYNLEVHGGKILPATRATYEMTLAPHVHGATKLSGAVIKGDKDGDIIFPDLAAQAFPDRITGFPQYTLTLMTYTLAGLDSTWRGNWEDLEGSYLSQYGLLNDAVLELYSDGEGKRMKFERTKFTKTEDFTNPKSAPLEGDYKVSEPIPKMYLMHSTNAIPSASDKELTGRIGLFLDVFDATKKGQMVTEIAYINPNDPTDFLMYYEHPQHAKNVGSHPKQK